MPTRPGNRVISESLLAAARPTGVELVEQPLPAGSDALLAEIERTVPVCADEFGARPRLARCACLTLRRGQHQARQDGRAHRGASRRRARARARPEDHGGEHGRHLARRWPLPSCSRKRPIGSTSTGLSCSLATACQGSSTRAARSFRRRPRSGAEPWGPQPARRGPNNKAYQQHPFPIIMWCPAIPIRCPHIGAAHPCQP